MNGNHETDTINDALKSTFDERFPVRKHLTPISSTRERYELVCAANMIKRQWCKTSGGELRQIVPFREETVF